MSKKFISTSNRISRKFSKIITPDLEIVLPPAPVITNVGSISGSPLVGQTLSLTGFTYTGTGTVTYQWKRDAVNISGATNSTYTLTFNDDLTNISVLVTVSNSQGNDQDTATGVDVTFAAPTSLGDFSQTITQNTLTTIYYDSRVEIQGDPNLDYCTCTLSSGTIPTGMSISGLVLTGTPTTPQVAAPVTLRYTNSGGFVDVTCNITVEEQIIAPTITSAGTITQSIIGQSSAISGFAYDGSTGTTTYQWKLNGSNISGATSSTYTPIESEDGGLLTCQITVTNSADSDTSTTASSSIVYAAPQSSGNISSTLTEDVAGSIDYTTQVSVSGDADLSGGTWSVQSGTIPAGMTRTGGVISGTPTTPQTSSDLTLRYTNSGGFVDVTCSIVVSSSGMAPTITNVGTISGTGNAGSVLTISGTTWDETGTPTYQWVGSSSGNISGATDTSFVVPPELSGEDIDCSVTVTNSYGSDNAVASGPTCNLVEVPIQFSTSDKSATVTLSDGNTAASMSSNSLACVRSSVGFDDTVGNFYFELSWPATAIVSTAYIGVSDPTSALTANSNADDKDYITFVAFDGRYNSRAGSAFTGGITPNLTGGDTVRIAVVTTGVMRTMCVGTSAGWVLGDPDVDPENGLVLPKTGPLKIHCCPRSANATVFKLRTATSDLNFACPTTCAPAARVLGFRQHTSADEADAIVDRLGINGHFANGGTGWQNDTDWHTPLSDLGIRYLRTNTSGSSVTYGLMLNFPNIDYLVLGAPKTGTPVPTFPTTNMNNGWNATITNVGASRLIGVEGGNEVNDGAATGWEGRTNTASAQVKALRDADAPGIPMLTPSVHRRSTAAMQALEADVAQDTYSTIANIHVYSGAAKEVSYTDNATNAIAPYTIVSDVKIGYSIGDALRIWGLNDFWVTEFGTQQQGIGAAASGFIGNDTAAKYLLRQICGMYSLGASKYFIYSLFDDVGVNKYGLLSASDGENYVKRPTYHAVQRLIDILEDPGVSHVTDDIDIFLTGDVSNIASLVFQKRDGTRYLVLYQQALSWNDTTHTAISVPPINVEVAIASKAASVTKWEPSLSASSSSVGTNIYSWTAPVKDEVSIYEIEMA